MPVHTSALYASVNGSSAYAALTALTDSFFSVGANSLTPPRDCRVLAAAAGGSGLTKARIEAPGLLRVAYPGITPLNNATTTGASKPRVANFTNRPFLLTGGEAVSLTVQKGGAAATMGLLVVGFDLVPIPPGEAFWLRYSKTGITANAGSWTTNTSVTWEQTVPSGTYAIIGMDHWGATAMAARVWLPASRYRPGCIAHTTPATGEQNSLFLDGSLGVLGYFTNQQLPGIDILCEAADTSFDGMLLVIRIGGPEMMPAPAR
jgi:hypothetical protein